MWMALLPFVSSDPGPLSIVNLGSCGGLVAKLCLTLATPWTVAHQAPLSMGFFQARIPKWVSISFSRASSQPRDQTQVSCTEGRFFTNQATREFHGSGAITLKFHVINLNWAVPWDYSNKRKNLQNLVVENGRLEIGTAILWDVALRQ